MLSTQVPVRQGPYQRRTARLQAHDIAAEEISQELISRINNVVSWRQIFSKSHVIQESVYADWPQPDFVHHDTKKRITCAYEFKPHDADKQELLKGLGQAIAYRVYFDHSVLIAPEVSEIGFLKAAIRANRMNIGLIGYSATGDLRRMKAGLNLLVSLKPERKRKLLPVDSGPFWAYYRDMSFEEALRLLSYAREACEKESEDIKDDAFKRIFRDITSGQTKTLSGRPRSVKNTRKNRMNYKKNYVALFNHLGLWSQTGELTEGGRSLLDMGMVHGANSWQFKDAFAGILLVNGRHLRLVEAFKECQQNLLASKRDFNREEYAKRVEAILENRGFIKRNPKRGHARVSRLPLTDELSLWSKLGLMKVEGRKYFQDSRGLSFDDTRILHVVAPFIAGGTARA